MMAWVQRHLTLPLLAAGFIGVVAAYFRLTQLGQQILIDDEWHALHALIRLDYQHIFLSFGHADHSIPLTLLFKALAETIGLSEWRMRFFPVVGGLVTVALVPWLLKPWLRSYEPWVLATLLALSPILIHFSRYVRPYALTIPLTFAAVVALWRWWHEGRRVWIVVFVPAAVLAGWLHPLSLLFTGGGLLWFGLVSLKDLLKNRDMSGLMRVVPPALAVIALSSALILPPLLADPHSMAAKTGVDQLKWDTLVWAWELAVGSSHWGMAALMVALALMGLGTALKRDPLFVFYWLFVSALALVVVSLLNPAWVHHALVPVRYLSVAIPWLLSLIAIGFVVTLTWVTQFNTRFLATTLTLSAFVLWIAGLVGSGPLLPTYGLVNQFAGAARYHHDYDYENNPYVVLLEQFELPEVYQQMQQEPGEWVVIEAPWSFESHSTPLVGYQRQHQMPIKIGMITGLCADRAYGEVPYDDPDIRIRLNSFVHLADLPWAATDQNRFVVINRQSVVEDRVIPETIERCVDDLSAKLGEAWYTDDQRIVYRLPAVSD